MREPHRLGIRWNTVFPTQRCLQLLRVDVQQYQIGSAGVQPVGRQVHLLGRRQVDESGFAQRCGGAKFSAGLRDFPVSLSAQVE